MHKNNPGNIKLKTQSNGKIKYKKVGNVHGEYFIQEKNGNLLLYNKDGQSGEARCIKP